MLPLVDRLDVIETIDYYRHLALLDVGAEGIESSRICRDLSRALPVGHAFSDKFSLVSFCNVLLPRLCVALFMILPTQR